MTYTVWGGQTDGSIDSPHFLKYCLNLGPFGPFGDCRAGRGNWAPPKAKIDGRTTGEKVVKKAEITTYLVDDVHQACLTRAERDAKKCSSDN